MLFYVYFFVPGTHLWLFGAALSFPYRWQRRKGIMSVSVLLYGSAWV
jgi:hypothetical protein